MTASAAQTQDPAPITACTISRDVQNFDLLIEDMEALLGERWGDLGFGEAQTFLAQPDAAGLQFIAIAIDTDDETDIAAIGSVVATARDRGVQVIVVAEDVTPASLHQLLRQGADEFLPYPLPEGELKAAVSRLRRPARRDPDPVAAPRLSGGGDGVLIAVQGLAGGIGATTLAVTLAHELATHAPRGITPARVCLVDLGLQYGSVATYLDLERRDAVLEVLSDIDSMDEESFAQALETCPSGLRVLTAPPDILPLDLIGPDEVKKLLDTAREHFDFVIVDMPQAVVMWTETVLTEAHVFFGVTGLDMRSAQNVLRLKRALKAEDLPFEKLRFVLNRAPKFTDLQGRSRVKRMAESLGIALELRLPDGGIAVAQACDHGEPLAQAAPKNPLRREIAKLAQELRAIGLDTTEAA